MAANGWIPDPALLIRAGAAKRFPRGIVLRITIYIKPPDEFPCPAKAGKTFMTLFLSAFV
jgi:hypothetical protein